MHACFSILWQTRVGDASAFSRALMLCSYPSPCTFRHNLHSFLLPIVQNLIRADSYIFPLKICFERRNQQCCFLDWEQQCIIDLLDVTPFFGYYHLIVLQLQISCYLLLCRENFKKQCCAFHHWCSVKHVITEHCKDAARKRLPFSVTEWSTWQVF